MRKNLHNTGECTCAECVNRDLRWRLGQAAEALSAAQRSIEIVSQVLKEHGETLPRSWGLNGRKKRNWSPTVREAARQRMKDLWAAGRMGKNAKKTT